MNGFDFQFSRIVVVESLENFEVKTGHANVELLKGILEEVDIKIPVDYFQIESSIDFVDFIESLKSISSKKDVPILHIECHGDIVDGLEFANGSTISWEDLSILIAPLNFLTGCRLVICLSACYSAQFLGQLGAITTPCPCRAIVAPETTLDPSDCLRGYRIFYGELLRTLNITNAFKAIRSNHTFGVEWVGELAEEWFIRLVNDFIFKNCTKKEVRKRVAFLHDECKKRGYKRSMSEIKKEVYKYFINEQFMNIYTQYFGINNNPEIDKTFNFLVSEFEDWAKVERRKGKLVI